MGDEDTICALSTPEGHGGIAVIRVSGSDAASVVRRLCVFLPDTLESHKIYYGILKGKDGTEIDEVLVSYFAKGRSFTGESTIEISCHGSTYLSLAILQELQDAGCRMARAGEFTYRAYMNGRMDLVQAEGVLGLIQSGSKLSSRAAIHHLRGNLSNSYRNLENEIMSVISQLEADIDFTHENLSVDSYDILVPKLERAHIEVKSLLATYSLGRQLREGTRVLITGAPNVGKSSLMNVLAGEEKSIVTATPGTTRDLVEFRTSAFGSEVAFIDSAGLRESNDEIEIAGIKKAKKELRDCDYAILVVDVSEDVDTQIGNLENELKDKKILVVGNKLDLNPQFLHPRVVSVSLKENVGVDKLVESIRALLNETRGSDSHIVTQSRHAELLKKMEQGLSRGIECLRQGVSPELAVFDLKETVASIHELLGIQVDDRVLDRVFKEFCIGK